MVYLKMAQYIIVCLLNSDDVKSKKSTDPDVRASPLIKFGYGNLSKPISISRSPRCENIDKV